MYNDLIVKKNINTELFQEAIEHGYSKNQANIIASKFSNIHDANISTYGTLSDIPDLTIMSGITESAELIHKAIVNNEVICLLTDYDSDGINGATVLYRFLVDLFNIPKENIVCIINKRSNGNGITDKLVDTVMLEHSVKKIGLIISSDHGSANGVSIAKLQESGIKVCITDHHQVPVDNNANNADAFVNPQKDEINTFKYISGCAVSYFVMKHLYDLHRDTYKDDKDVIHTLLPMVAISTIGDSMSLIDPINRILTRLGINEMNSLRGHHWQAVKYCLDSTTLFDVDDIGYVIVPAINAASRMGNPQLALDFYIKDNYRDAVIAFETLINVNNDRKKLQKHLIKLALLQCIGIGDKYSLTIVMDRGFGLNGIISSSVGEKMFKPIVTFVKEGGILHGSGRSINENFNLLQAFKNIEAKDKSIFIKFGGHKLAAGCTVHPDKINDFKHYFEDEARIQLVNKEVIKKYEVIDVIEHKFINEGLIEDIALLAPYGIGFEKVNYVTKLEVHKVRYVGRESEHITITFKTDTGKLINAFIFNSNDKFDHDLLKRGNYVKVIFRPKLKSFRGTITFDLEIDHLSSI